MDEILKVCLVLKISTQLIVSMGIGVKVQGRGNMEGRRMTAKKNKLKDFILDCTSAKAPSSCMYRWRVRKNIWTT